MTAIDFDKLATQAPLMAILRNFPPDRALALATRAWDLGIDMVEVPIHKPEFLPSLETVLAAGRERGKPVGAGTITNQSQLDIISTLGVDFAVAPGLDVELALQSVKRGIPFIPGAATPTEVQSALTAGFTWIKGFPATALGPSWFTAIRGPFPDACLVATGGIDASNASDYLQAGARIVAIGSALEDPHQLELISHIISDGSA